MYTYQLFTMNAFIIYCKDLLRKKEKITSGIFPEPTDLRGQEILSNIKKNDIHLLIMKYQTLKQQGKIYSERTKITEFLTASKNNYT